MAANTTEFNGSTVSVVTATTTSGVAIAQNSNRKYLTVCNTGAVDAFLAVATTAVIGSGIYLKAGSGTWESNATNFTKAAVNCISASATTTLSILEGF